jgi:hypothetical protein
MPKNSSEDFDFVIYAIEGIAAGGESEISYSTMFLIKPFSSHFCFVSSSNAICHFTSYAAGGFPPRGGDHGYGMPCWFPDCTPSYDYSCIERIEL